MLGVLFMNCLHLSSPYKIPFHLLSQTYSLRIYLLPLANGVWKQNAFQLKLEIIMFPKPKRLSQIFWRKGKP